MNEIAEEKKDVNEESALISDAPASEYSEDYTALVGKAVPPRDKVEAKREALRNGRINRAGTDTGGDSAPIRGTDGTSIQIVQRKGRRDERTHEESDHNRRSTDKKSRRVGRPTRRPGENHGAPDHAVSENAAAGTAGLAAAEPIPVRIEPEFAPGDIAPASAKRRSRSRGKADEPAKKSVGLFFKNTPTLTKQEAEALAEPLIAALIDDFGYLDEFLWWYTQDKTQAPIWGDVDREEAETLARVLLKRGQRSPATAATVRAVVNGSDYLSALIITIPRIIKTVDAVRKAPKRIRPSRRERLAMMKEQGERHENHA